MSASMGVCDVVLYFNLLFQRFLFTIFDRIRCWMLVYFVWLISIDSKFFLDFLFSFSLCFLTSKFFTTSCGTLFNLVKDWLWLLVRYGFVTRFSIPSIWFTRWWFRCDHNKKKEKVSLIFHSKLEAFQEFYLQNFSFEFFVSTRRDIGERAERVQVNQKKERGTNSI